MLCFVFGGRFKYGKIEIVLEDGGAKHLTLGDVALYMLERNHVLFPRNKVTGTKRQSVKQPTKAVKRKTSFGKRKSLEVKKKEKKALVSSQILARSTRAEEDKEQDEQSQILLHKDDLECHFVD